MWKYVCLVACIFPNPYTPGISNLKVQICPRGVGLLSTRISTCVRLVVVCAARTGVHLARLYVLQDDDVDVRDSHGSNPMHSTIFVAWNAVFGLQRRLYRVVVKRNCRRSWYRLCWCLCHDLCHRLGLRRCRPMSKCG